MSKIVESLKFVRLIYRDLWKMPLGAKISYLNNFTYYVNEKIQPIEFVHFELAKNRVLRKSFLGYEKAKDYWSILNPREYACLARNKYLSHLLLESANIPCAELYAYYSNLTSNDSRVVNNYDGLINLIRANKLNCFVVKPANDSSHGDGVFICRKIVNDVNNEYLIEKSNGETISLRYFLETHDNILFESIIRQTGQFDKFNSSSVNTIRVMTALYPDDTVKIFAAFVKIGRDGSDVDNAGNGGNVDCGVELQSGVMYNVIEFNSWINRKYIACHPDSNARIDGVTIEKWSYIEKALKEFAKRIPYLKTIGWDVALTDEGPVIIEINNWWDTTGQLFIGRGWRDDVVDCYNAWNNYYQNKK